MRFGAFLVFAGLWSVLVYAVLAHWAFGGGWLQAGGTLDFAGGVPVEMGSGFSALAAALVVGARKDHGRQAILPHNSVYVLLGAGLLWFGWFGFNGGSGFSAGNAGRARVRQHAADARVRARHVVRARPDPLAAGHGDRRRHRDRGRLRRHHAGRRLHQPDVGDGARHRRRAAELRRDHAAPAHARGRDARRARRARRGRPHGHPLHRLRRPGGVERRVRRPALRQRRAARRPGAGRARRARLRVRRHVRAAQAHRPVQPAARDGRRGGARAWTS